MCRKGVAGAMAQLPAERPWCLSSGQACALLAAHVLAAVAGVVMVRKQSEPHETVFCSGFLIGITSVWILAPAVIAAGTPASMLSALGPRLLLLRRAVMLLCLLSCPVSVVTWYRWDVLTASSDVTLAIGVLSSSLLFGMLRGGWVGCSTWGLFCATFLLVIAEQSLEQYQPWPHLIFRTAGCLCIVASINAGLLIETLPHVLQVALVMGSFFYSHVLLEFWLMDYTPSACDSGGCLKPGPYFAGIVRTGLVLLCCVLCLRSHCQSAGSDSVSEDDSSGESSSEPFKD